MDCTYTYTAAFADTDAGLMFSSLCEGEAASFVFRLLPDTVPPHFAPLVFGPPPPPPPPLPASSDDEATGGFGPRGVKTTPLDRARAAAAAHARDDALARGNEEKAAVRREARARARAQVVKAHNEYRQVGVLIHH